MNQSLPVGSDRTHPLSWAFDLAMVTSVFVLGVRLVNPLGDFPLNDDWSYGLTVQRLVEEGTYDPVGWQAVSLFSQALWGALVSSVFGFSQTMLRFSTLVLSWVAVVAIYFLTKELGGNRGAAIAASLTLAFNPIYFALSHTFMSDVPFAAFVAVSMLFLLRSLKLDSDVYLASGTFVAVLAVLCRQNGLFVPIAFGIAYLARHELSIRSVLKAALPAAVAASALFVYQNWLEAMGRVPAQYGALSLVNVAETAHPLRMVAVLLVAASYLGFFLAPALAWKVLSPVEERGGHSWGTLGILLGASTALLVIVFPGASPLPDLGNILNLEGIGPLTLRDTYLLGLPNVGALPSGLWAAVRLMGLVGGVILCTQLAMMSRRMVAGVAARELEGPELGAFFCVVGAGVCFAPLMLTELFYDRYLIPLALVLAPALVCSRNTLSLGVPRGVRTGSVGLLAGAFAVVSVLTTHDYLAWNRARWSLVADALENGEVRPSQLDGGFEVNGYYLYAEDYEPVTDESKSWWWVADDLYLVSFGPVPGYRVERRHEFVRWLPREEGSVLLLKRETGPPAAALSSND